MPAWIAHFELSQAQHHQLAGEMRDGFAAVDRRFERVEGRLDRLEFRMDGLENEFRSFRDVVVERDSDMELGAKPTPRAHWCMPWEMRR